MVEWFGMVSEWFGAAPAGRLREKLRQTCSADLEHLTILCRPHYLPREFSGVIITAVYIPPQANTETALSSLHDTLSRHQRKYPDAAMIITGDFNRANLKKVMPNFRQHITCATRGDKTLDHCYTPFKNGYKAVSCPPPLGSQTTPPFC